MSATFHDHFSRAAQGYAQARPTYPEALFRLFAEAAPARESAWDCATGNGQAARGLARYFARVEATDASAQQIEHAVAAPNVHYSVQPAETTTFAPESFDAICVAQAVHWFDIERFYAEVRRVLRPGGILLVMAYGWQNVTPEFDRELKRLVIDPVRPLWPEQNALILNHYRDLPFPFERVPFPPLAIEVCWTLAQMMDYIGTWTATRRMLEKDPEFLVRSRDELVGAWGAEELHTVTMPLTVHCGRHGGR